MLNWLKRKLGLNQTNHIELINTETICEILNKVDDSSMLATIDGDILFANDYFKQQFNYQHNPARRIKLYDPAIGLTTEEQFASIVKALREHNKRIMYEREMTMPNGKVRYSQMSVVLYHVDGKEHLWFFARNITQLRERENELRDLNQLLNVIIDNLPVYLFVKEVDNDFRYILWNKAFAEYSKIPASKVIGNTDFDVFPDYKDAMHFRQDDLDVVKSGKDLIKKLETYRDADGTTRLVQTFKSVVKRKGKPLLIGMSLDMTNLQNIEQELVQERLKAEESDRLKSRFLANMSHEIRTPLNAIVGFSSLLADAETEEERHEFSKIINQNSEVLLQLINDILDLSKIEAGTLEYTRMPMDLLDTCRNIYHVQKERVQEGVKLLFDNDCMEGQFMINEDRNRITQVIDNLINNAIKFTSKGEIHYGFTVKGDIVEFYVKDTGKGIPKDKQEMVFDRFVKLDNFAQGTGLGLPICKLIVETLGGRISLDSEVGEGTTFRFTIPYKKDHNKFNNPPVTSSKPVAAKPVAAKSDCTILVAEDVASNYLVVKAMVKGRYNLIWARNGIEAVQMAKEKKPDMVLMDIKMPEMNGLDAAREIRKFDTKVPIVALTANVFESDKAVALHAGMNDILSKPLMRDEFEQVLETYL